MTPAWRQFELFVARLEEALSPSGAVVKSPDRVVDKVTGESREVDASIKYKVGTTSILITVECRDRTSVEDVRWIEQLAEKQRSIGASATLAVSSSGFSAAAIKKAESVGIQTRLVTDATPVDFAEWLKLENVEQMVDEWAMSGLDIELYDAPGDVDFAPELRDELRRSGQRAPILTRPLDGARFSIEQFVIEWRKQNGSFFPPDLQCGGPKLRKCIRQPIERGRLTLETTCGVFNVQKIHVELELSRTRSQMPLSRLSKYSSPSSELVQAAEWTIADTARLSLFLDIQSGEIKGRVDVEEQKTGRVP